MHDRARPIDVGSMPDLEHLAEEVYETGEPRLLRRDDQDLAIVMPVPRRGASLRPVATAEDIAAFRSSAGGWQGLVDTDTLVDKIYESRRLAIRPPLDL